MTKKSSEQFKSISDMAAAQLSSMEDLADQARILSHMSQSLREQTGRFTIGG